MDFLFDPVPLWALPPLLFTALLASHWLGLQLHRVIPWTDDRGDEGHILAGTLGLLALMIGFTFAMALDSFEDRRRFVVAEANAAAAAWLRADLLPQPQQAQSRALLRDYLDALLIIAQAQEDSEAVRAARTSVARIEKQYWKLTVAASPSAVPAGAQGLVDGANDLVSASAARQAALESRVPPSVLASVIIYALIAAMMVGYVMGGYKGQHRFASTLLFLMLTLAISLIFDLDRPRGGTINVSPKPLLDLRAQMGE